ncbi:MAG TPA: hypothetical protein PK347_00365 [Burkholderiaceae bacterium]|nr:hypothetical protein [Burkholderiaceae bacterium]
MLSALFEKLSRAVAVYDELNRSGKCNQSFEFHAQVARDAYKALERLRAAPTDPAAKRAAERALKEVQSELVILCHSREDKNPRRGWPAAQREARQMLGGATC